MVRLRAVNLSIFLGIMGVLAFVGMFLVMRWGPGADPDSVWYMEAARNILAGRGIVINGHPMSHWPPGYPLLLAVAGWLLGGNLVQAARFLSAFFFGLTLVLFGLVSWMCTEGSLLAVVLASLFYVSSFFIVRVYSMAWSEPLFIFLALCGFVFLSLYIVYSNVYLLVLSAIFVGFAALTRYVGVTLLPPVLLTLFLFGRNTRTSRWKALFLFLLVALLPLCAWLARNILLLHSPTDRVLALHLPPFTFLILLVVNALRFFFYMPLSHWTGQVVFCAFSAFFLLFLALGMAAYWSNELGAGERERRFASVFVFLSFTYAGVYMVFILVSRALFDAQIPANHRMVLPAMVPLVPATLALAWFLAKASGKNLIWYAFASFLFISALANGYHAVGKVKHLYRDGVGYLSRKWQGSETMAFLRWLKNKDIQVYSNGPDAILLLTGMRVRRLPRRFSANSLVANKNFTLQLEKIYEKCRRNEAVVVIFKNIHRRYLPSAGEIELSLPVLKEFSDGVILGKKQAICDQTSLSMHISPGRSA